MADLITTARAKYNIAQTSFTSAEDTTIAALVTACSKAIRRYCRREFDSQPFDELYNGTRQPLLILNQFPIVSVERVAYGPTAVLQVTNASAANQRATARVTATALELTRVASGVSTTNTLTFAANPTLSAMKAAVDALGNGWSATIPDAAHTNRAAADLRALQGACNAKDALAEMKLHLFELTDFDVDAARGYLWRSRSGWLDPLEVEAEWPTWFGGVHNWRVQYTAGFATVPEDVQEACAHWVAALYWQTKRDPGLAHETVPGAVERRPVLGMPPAVLLMLEPYRNLRV
ncbi:MAG: hypothetical protein L0215_22310 [Gemmataceae bacterium]|nr:hypothetical protein [Gemmataceae bacterium]